MNNRVNEHRSFNVALVLLFKQGLGRHPNVVAVCFLPSVCFAIYKLRAQEIAKKAKKCGSSTHDSIYFTNVFIIIIREVHIIWVKSTFVKAPGLNYSRKC